MSEIKLTITDDGKLTTELSGNSDELLSALLHSSVELIRRTCKKGKFVEAIAEFAARLMFVAAEVDERKPGTEEENGNVRD